MFHPDATDYSLYLIFKTRQPNYKVRKLKLFINIVFARYLYYYNIAMKYCMQAQDIITFLLGLHGRAKLDTLSPAHKEASVIYDRANEEREKLVAFLMDMKTKFYFVFLVYAVLL